MRPFARKWSVELQERATAAALAGTVAGTHRRVIAGDFGPEGTGANGTDVLPIRTLRRWVDIVKHEQRERDRIARAHADAAAPNLALRAQTLLSYELAEIERKMFTRDGKRAPRLTPSELVAIGRILDAARKADLVIGGSHEGSTANPPAQRATPEPAEPSTLATEALQRANGKSRRRAPAAQSRSKTIPQRMPEDADATEVETQRSEEPSTQASDALLSPGAPLAAAIPRWGRNAGDAGVRS